MIRDAGERFLLIAPQGLGDSLEATPILRALRRAHPRARIEVAVTPSSSRTLFESLPDHVDAVLDLPFWEKGGAAFLAALAKAGRRRRYDASFLAFPSARMAYQLLSAVLSRQAVRPSTRRTRVRLPSSARRWSTSVRHNVERTAICTRGGIDRERTAALVRRVGSRPRADQATVSRSTSEASRIGVAAKRWPLSISPFWRSACRTHRREPIVGGRTRELAGAKSGSVLKDGPGSRVISGCAAVVASEQDRPSRPGGPRIALSDRRRSTTRRSLRMRSCCVRRLSGVLRRAPAVVRCVATSTCCLNRTCWWTWSAHGSRCGRAVAVGSAV